MTTRERAHELTDRALALAAMCRVVFAGEDPDAVGAAMAETMATFLRGHKIVGDPRGEHEMRDAILEQWVKTVRDLLLTEKLGDGPIETQYIEMMNAMASALDEMFNGKAKGNDRKTGFDRTSIESNCREIERLETELEKARGERDEAIRQSQGYLKTARDCLDQLADKDREIAALREALEAVDFINGTQRYGFF